MVDEGTDLRVLEDEKRSYEQAIEGVYGEEKQKVAQQRGLLGIVLKRQKNGFRDLIKEEDIDLPYQAIRYPEKLLCKPKGKANYFYYQMKQFGPYKNTYEILKDLKQDFNIDPYSEEAAELLRKSTNIYY